MIGNQSWYCQSGGREWLARAESEFAPISKSRHTERERDRERQRETDRLVNLTSHSHTPDNSNSRLSLLRRSFHLRQRAIFLVVVFAGTPRPETRSRVLFFSSRCANDERKPPPSFLLLLLPPYIRRIILPYSSWQKRKDTEILLYRERSSLRSFDWWTRGGRDEACFCPWFVSFPRHPSQRKIERVRFLFLIGRPLRDWYFKN